MIITSIEINKNIVSMAQVHLDDSTSFCLPLKRISILNLDEGNTISAETLEYILTCEVYGAAKSAAVRYFALKLRTSHEINQKLSELGYEENTINKVIENLIEIEYLNDYKYTVKYISEKIKLQPKSVKLLSMELSHKGIPDDIIFRAFEEIDLDEDNIAFELLKKKYSRQTSYDEKVINKMRSFLMNRGFNYQQTSKAISKFLPED
ncbi:MAG TPA: regulatory protein RecX [Ruminiclostridium sp.]